METVVGALPNELWALVAQKCNTESLVALASTCHTLNDIAGAYLDDRWISFVRVGIDAFIDLWERATSEWDQEWREDQGEPQQCENCSYAPDAVDDDVQREGKTARWMCDEGVPGRDWTHWVCDACAQEALHHPSNIGGMVWPLRRIRLDVPHVWSINQFDDYAASIHPTPSVANFAVPPDMVRMLDPHATDAVKDWVRDNTMLFWHNVCPSLFSSLRAWLPLQGTHTAHPVKNFDLRHIRMPMVCCDAESPMWGAIVVVEYHMAFSTATWYGIEDSFDALVGRWQGRPTDQMHLTGWVEWACEIYIDRPYATRKTECARNGLTETGLPLDWDSGTWCTQ